MRIGITLFSRDEKPSGVEQYGLGLIRALLEFCPRCSLTVYTNRPALLPTETMPPSRVAVRRLRLPGRLGRAAWEQLALPRQARRDRLDVLHCTSYIAPMLGCHVPCVATVHDVFAIDEPRWCTRANRLYYRFALRRGLLAADAVVTPSHWAASALVRRMPQVAPKLRVVCPGVDSLFFRPPGPGEEDNVRGKYELPERYLLHVGNIEPRKNIDTLLSTFENLRRRGWPGQLVLVGGRSWRSRCLVKRLARAEGVRLPGYADRSDLPALYRMSRAYVCLARAEGFGFPVLEAMASGAVVLHSGGGALTETTGGVGRLTDPTSPLAVADAVWPALRDEAARQEMIRRGRDRARRFPWPEAAKTMWRLYERMLSGESVRETKLSLS